MLGLSILIDIYCPISDTFIEVFGFDCQVAILKKWSLCWIDRFNKMVDLMKSERFTKYTDLQKSTDLLILSDLHSLGDLLSKSMTICVNRFNQ